MRWFIMAGALAVLFLLLFSLPVHADGLSATLFAAPNSDAILGAGASWQAQDHLWADAIAKRAEVGTDVALGASTDLQGVAALLNLAGLDVRPPNSGTRLGCGYLLREGEWFAYAAQPLFDF